MAEARRDRAQDRAIGELTERVEAVEEAVAEVAVEPRAPVDPEAAVQLRWVYSPGEVRLQIKQGSDPWVTVPNVRLEDADAEEAEQHDTSAG